MPDITYDTVPIDSLTPYPGNPRRGDLDAITASIQANGVYKPIVVQAGTRVILAGNHTWQAARALGHTTIKAAFVAVDDATAHRIVLVDNATNDKAGYDYPDLLALLDGLDDLTGTGYTSEDVADITSKALADLDTPAPPGIDLTAAYLVPPFSVLNTRSGEWQDRKRAWKALGIQSEAGRDQELTYKSGKGDFGDKMRAISGGTSVFDPVLTEIAYHWFSPNGGHVLDPFAGGSVRGVVAATTGRHYTGIDLNATQITANREQWQTIATHNNSTPPPLWIVGDSNTALDTLPDDYTADLLFSCPPYADLEVYSTDPADISNMPYQQFIEVYRAIIAKAVTRLSPNRFVVWVVSEVRAPNGTYRNFIADTIQAFTAAGADYYNELILLNAIGTSAMRVNKQFTTSRKAGRVHQNVLVFVKGDPRKATQACGPVAIPDITPTP